jgi:outer membrane protein OmpA-like peptidoglycan-associated protein
MKDTETRCSAVLFGGAVQHVFLRFKYTTRAFLMQPDTDQQERNVLFIVLPIVVLVVAGVVGLGVFKARAMPAQLGVVTTAVEAAEAAPAVLAAPGDDGGDSELASSPEAAADASIVVDGALVKFYFASSSADLAAGAGAALGDAVAAAKAGKFVVLSGFHDETGDATFNANLAKRRSMAVRAALLMAGAPEDRVVMKKPAVLTGSGSQAQARRVEVLISADQPA